MQSLLWRSKDVATLGYTPIGDGAPQALLSVILPYRYGIKGQTPNPSSPKGAHKYSVADSHDTPLANFGNILCSAGALPVRRLPSEAPLSATDIHSN